MGKEELEFNIGTDKDKIVLFICGILIGMVFLGLFFEMKHRYVDDDGVDYAINFMKDLDEGNFYMFTNKSSFGQIVTIYEAYKPIAHAILNYELNKVCSLHINKYGNEGYTDE